MVIKIPHFKLQSTVLDSWKQGHTISLALVHILKFFNEKKDLGVVLDQKLKFSSDVTNQARKANKLIGLIQRPYDFLDAFSLKNLFAALALNLGLQFGIHC